jgi:glutathione S-transferase
MAEATPAAAASKPKIILHWLEKSRSHRILWLLEEIGVEYELKTYKRVNMLAPPELKAIHPLGKSPVIGVQGPGQSKPRIIAESALIVEYINDYFGKQMIPQRWPEGKDESNGFGEETEEWMRYRYYMHYSEGSLMPLMIVALLVEQIRNAPVPFFLKPITRGIAGKIDSGYLNKNFTSHMDFLEDQLKTSGGDFFCGSQLTGADVMMVFPLEAGEKRVGITEAKYPLLHKYIRRIHEREAYKKAIKKVEDATGEKFNMTLG